jgi:glycosyltransferase involved in cell wall biosynthesis
MSTVGLCMIVKDEAHVIERCLTALRPHIDYWTIVDTGSTDGTQELIPTLLNGIPGQLLERPWVDFGHNRTEALEAARPHAEYSLCFDADEVFAAPAGFVWPTLEADAINLERLHGGSIYQRVHLVANRLSWRYRGVLHEYLETPEPHSSAVVLGPTVVIHSDGARSRGMTFIEKYARDARTLEAALIDEPDNSRYQFYLARSYRDSEQWDKALSAYRRRAVMGGFVEEVADSLFEVGRLLERAGTDPDEVAKAYLTAWDHRPVRAEPLAALARYYREHGRFAMARMVALQGMTIARPDDVLWLDVSVYEWRCIDEYAVSSYWTGDYEESAAASRRLLERRSLPDSQRARVEENLAFALDKLTAPRSDRSSGGVVPHPRQAGTARVVIP